MLYQNVNSLNWNHSFTTCNVFPSTYLQNIKDGRVGHFQPNTVSSFQQCSCQFLTSGNDLWVSWVCSNPNLIRVRRRRDFLMDDPVFIPLLFWICSGWIGTVCACGLELESGSAVNYWFRRDSCALQNQKVKFQFQLGYWFPCELLKNGRWAGRGKKKWLFPMSRPLVSVLCLFVLCGWLEEKVDIWVTFEGMSLSPVLPSNPCRQDNLICPLFYTLLRSPSRRPDLPLSS